MEFEEPALRNPEDGVDLGALWKLAWGSKYLILGTAFLFAAMATLVAFSMTPIFRAEIVVLAVHSGSVGGAGSFSGQLGGLANIASLAGVTLDSGGIADREAKAILESRKFAEDFIRQNNLLDVLLPISQKPHTLWFAVKMFREKVLLIRDDKRTGLTTLSIVWKDPGVAANWLNAYVALANERIRARAIEGANRNIKFLNEQIDKTRVVEVQRSIFGLIENETKTLMLANARTDYAFTVIDPSVPPERKIGPHGSLYALFGAFMGSIVGISVAYFRRARAGKIR